MLNFSKRETPKVNQQPYSPNIKRDIENRNGYQSTAALLETYRRKAEVIT
jgi:hypothetical protein